MLNKNIKKSNEINMINIFLINTEKVQQKDASSISKNYRQKTFENYPYVRGV